MAISEVIGEAYASRNGTVAKGGGDSINRQWFIRSDQWPNGNDDADVDTWVSGNSVVPPTYLGLERTGWTKKALGDGYWEVDARYGPFSQGAAIVDEFTLEEGEHLFEFRFTAQAETFVVAKAQSKFPATGPTEAPDHDSVIGFNPETRGITGTPVFRPTARFIETHVVPAVAITPQYKRDVLKLVGTTNDATFKGMNKGEALALGVTGSQRNNEDHTLTFEFAFRENKTGESVGSLNIGDVEGWQHVDAIPLTTVINNNVTTKVVHAYVNTIYDMGDFSQFGIGT